MKNMFLSLAILFTFTFANTLSAQSNPSIGILDLSVSGLNYDATLAANIARAELVRIDKFSVLNREDIRYELQRQNIQVGDCYAKSCLVDVGKAIKAAKMFSGSVEAYDGYIMLNLRVIDVASGAEETSHVQQYLNLPDQLPLMIQTSIRMMFGRQPDDLVFKRLTQKNEFESAVSVPEKTRLNLNGPRMGVAYFAGQNGRILSSTAPGGFNAAQVMFQFGYQFEVTYLNEGNFQALFECVPLITGLDQGKFFPSLSFLNGMRDSKRGWEVAFGPVINLVRMGKGYLDDNGKFILQSEGVPGGVELVKRIDSRGDLNFRSGFILAVGRSFRSGKLNLPVNAFFIPGKEGSHRFGISVGYNTRS